VTQPLGPTFDPSTILGLVQVFAIADSLLSLAVTYTLDRKAMIRWRRALWITLVMIWAATGLPLVELVTGSSLTLVAGGFSIANTLTKASVIVWAVGIARLLQVMYRVLTLDLIRFKKGNPAIKHGSPLKWGVEGIDKVLEAPGADIYYPVVIAADEYSRPWNILQRFLVSGQVNNPSAQGCIYITFARPAGQIMDALNRTAKAHFSTEFDPSRLVIIDCFTKFARQEEKSVNKGYKLILADPNNPHILNQRYENALKFLLSMRCTSIRVVYDALSDFLALTDVQLATQYLRHNMEWEELNNVESLYVLRSGTLPSELEQYFLWFANGTLRLTRTTDGAKDFLQADFRGPFNHAVTFRLDYDFKLIEQVRPAKSIS
jgi:hypothetical protein